MAFSGFVGLTGLRGRYLPYVCAHMPDRGGRRRLSNAPLVPIVWDVDRLDTSVLTCAYRPLGPLVLLYFIYCSLPFSPWHLFGAEKGGVSLGTQTSATDTRRTED